LDTQIIAISSQDLLHRVSEALGSSPKTLLLEGRAYIGVVSKIFGVGVLWDAFA